MWLQPALPLSEPCFKYSILFACQWWDITYDSIYDGVYLKDNLYNDISV